MNTFDAYLDTIEDEQNRSRTQEVLGWVGTAFPDLSPKIAWNQPMFTDHGTFIIGFSTSKKHLAVAPERVAIERFSEAIGQSGSKHSKELIRIPWNSPVDYDLLQDIIAFNRLDKADCQTFWRKP